MDINGILTKRGGRFKTWHRRHFELHNNTLSYFIYDGGPLKGEYIITADTTIEHSKLRKHCFCLSQKSGRSLFMFADSTADQELWMNALNRAIVRTRMQSNKSKEAVKLDSRPRSSTTGHLELSESDNQNPYQHMNLWELHITVLQARNLSAKGSNNTYAKVLLDTQSSTTKVVKKELNPVWDESFSFVWSAEQRYARVEVWDTDPLLSSRDNFLGVVYIPILSIPYGNADAKWYTLGKRSSRSNISGEIQILAYSDKTCDENSRRLLRELQSLPELANSTTVDSFCSKILADLDTSDTSMNEEYWNLLHQIQGRFPTQMPPVETEVVEDIALKVSMKPYVERSSYGDACISSDGILVLTNYRLIFVSHSRLAFANEDSSSMSSSMSELTTAIPLAQIVSVELTIAQDPLQTTGVLYDCLLIRTNDSRVFSIVFLGMELGVNELTTEFKTRSESTSRLGLFSRSRSRRSASVDTPSNQKEKLKLSKHTRRTSVSKDAAGTENISYLEAQNSQEGPPSQRFCFRLQWKIINRCCLVGSLKGVHQSLLHAVLKGAGVDISGADTVTAIGRTAISSRDMNELPLDDSTLAETLEPFSRESNEIKELTTSYDHTESGLQQWIKSLPSQLKFGLYKVLRGGWHVYSPHDEFARMGIPDALWRISDANSDYELCSTYPAVVAVPNSVDDHSLTLASLFRSRGRFPALSWRHPTNYCSLTRSSQPLVGLGQNRSADDEQLIRAINQASAFNGLGETVNLTTNRRVVPSKQIVTNDRGVVTKPLVIVDARPKINAQANQAVGKGYEMGKSYEDCKVIFMGIANIHVMRKSIDALENSCCNSLGDDANWLKNLDNSGWLQHLSLVLSASARIVHCITKECYSVLVHCSDGWDRTAQLTSLSMLMMDPYYRTFEGFQVLIEKEWFSFGHKFCDRLGWRDQGWSDDERSPVFHQFLDCVYQCIHQNAAIFEFNESLLLFIATHVLSGWFGNVFANNEMERITLQESTISIWTFIGLNKQRFVNDSFSPFADAWTPRCSPQNITLWRGWFLKWHNTLWELGWNRKNEDFSEVHETPSEWMADSEVQRCCYCNQRFDFIHRRHHCRACGQIFCESCVKNFRIVRTVSESTPVRVCFSCVQLMDEGTEKYEEDDIYLDGEVIGMPTSHKDSTTSIFGKMRSTKSDFSIDNEKYSLGGSSASGRESESRVVSTRTEKYSVSTSPGKDSSRPSIISRVGMMMRSKSANSVTSTSANDEKEDGRGHSDGMERAAAELNRDSEGSALTLYPTDRANEVKLQARQHHPPAMDGPDDHVVQSIHPFSLSEEHETDGNERLPTDEGSMSSHSASSEKRVNFALEDNIYQDPVKYSKSKDKRRSMDGDNRHGSSRHRKSGRARSHSPADHRERHHRASRKPSSSSSSTLNTAIPKQLKIEKAGTNQSRDPVKKTHSGRYDAFTKPVNLGPRRTAGNG